MNQQPAPEFELASELVSAIEAAQLSVRLIDNSDRAQVDCWRQVVSRGFLDSERTEQQLSAFYESSQSARKLGIFDPSAPQPELPVATMAAWLAELSLPGGVVSAYAISGVTVAPTHRRRGLLRSLLGGELRAAAAAGFGMAALTASEAGIYGRFGFAPAAFAADVTIKTRQAGWIGPEPAGRIDFLTRAQGRELAPGLHNRVRPGRPGEIDQTAGDWDQLFGIASAAEKAEVIRVIQYRSRSGEVDGLAVYSVTENLVDYASSTLNLARLIAATDDAYAGLWRFLLEMDLIGTIRAGELSVDEPLWWMIADRRAATVTVRDHQYLRILDIRSALAARRYEQSDSVLLEIDDRLGLTSGTYRLTTSPDGFGQVDEVAASVAEPVTVRLGVAELSAILLGGVSPVTLARAGRLQAADPARILRLFASSVTPELSFWY